MCRTLEEDGAEGPCVGEEGGPLAAHHHLGRLARVQEVALGQRVPDEEVLEVPQAEVGDLQWNNNGSIYGFLVSMLSSGFPRIPSN